MQCVAAVCYVGRCDDRRLMYLQAVHSLPAQCLADLVVLPSKLEVESR